MSGINLYKATRSLGTLRAAEVRLMYAAIESHGRGCAPESCGGSRLDPCYLSNAIEHLTTVACQECNAGGHTCPGDGNPIPHGAADCGEHDDADEPQRMVAMPPMVDSAASALDTELIWVERTWADVRRGDMVKLPGSEAAPAFVVDAKRQAWHVDPRTGTSGSNPPRPMEWECVRVTLADRAPTPDQPIRQLGSWDMDPAKPVLLELAQSEVDALDAAGWNNRASLLTS